MDELKTRVKALLNEIEYTHLKKRWVERLIAGGIEERDAYKWVAEIGHIVDAYELSLQALIDLLQESDAVSAAEELEGWVAYTRDFTMWKLDRQTSKLIDLYIKYLPTEPDDSDQS